MKSSALHDAFAHHVWATLRVIDACVPLTTDQLATAVPGTYGSILETVRHLVGADAAYLFVTSSGRRSVIDEEEMGLPELRSAMVENAPAWQSLLSEDPDADSGRIVPSEAVNSRRSLRAARNPCPDS